MVGSTVLTGAVAAVLGVAVGVVGVIAAKDAVAPSAEKVASEQTSTNTAVTKPQVYGSR